MLRVPQSDIAFSQVREDCEIEWQVLDRLSQLMPDRPLRVLIVASGGCTALNLLAHPYIGEITTVDANPAQIQLLKLRCAAIARHQNLRDEAEPVALERPPKHIQIRCHDLVGCSSVAERCKARDLRGRVGNSRRR